MTEEKRLIAESKRLQKKLYAIEKAIKKIQELNINELNKKLVGKYYSVMTVSGCVYIRVLNFIENSKLFEVLIVTISFIGCSSIEFKKVGYAFFENINLRGEQVYLKNKFDEKFGEVIKFLQNKRLLK